MAAMSGKLRSFVRRLPANALLGFDVLLFNPLLCLLPYGRAFPVTRARGDLQFRLMKAFRARVLRDLEECLPERTGAERRAIAREVFRMQATFFYDTFMWTRYRERAWTRKFVTFRGLEHLAGSLDRGRGAIVFTAHFNQYFYPGGFLIARGYPVAGYAVSPWDMKKVPFFTRLPHAYLIWMSQWKTKARFVLAGRHARGEIEKLLAENRTLYVVLDIPHPEKQDLVPVDFLGKEAWFPSGGIHLRYKTGVPVHVLHAFRDRADWRRQTVVISPEISFSGDVRQDLQAVVTRLERAVREHPESWWGWGMVDRLRPEHIRKARERGEVSTSVVYSARQG
jgi:Kdo2-lipid IVA lauroyltransferase/acyltransferase